MNKYNLKIGQVLYVRFADIYHTVNKIDFVEATVSKLGRKWATLSRPGYCHDLKLDLETLRLDDGHYQAWLSPAAYTNTKALHAAWRDFCSAVTDARYRPPSELSLEAIKEARAKLGL